MRKATARQGGAALEARGRSEDTYAALAFVRRPIGIVADDPTT